VPEQRPVGETKRDLSSLTLEPALTTVRDLLTTVSRELGNNFLAVWFDGSIALGAFDPQRSDIDLVVVTSDYPSVEETSGLRVAHARCAQGAPDWGDEIEIIYVTSAALQLRAVSSGVPHLYVERGSRGELRSGPLDPGWLVHLRVLREHGRSITGPEPIEMVAAVSDDELKRVAIWGAERWLTPHLEDPTTLARLGVRVFVVLTTCRLLYTLQSGQVVSKMTAARWALDAVPADLAPVIQGAMAWQKHDAVSESTTVKRTLALIKWTQSACRT
jgi:hypothetical protein